MRRLSLAFLLIVSVASAYDAQALVKLHSREVTLPPHGNVQYNDLASTFGFARQDGIQIE